MNTNLPIACSLDSPALAQRRSELRSSVLSEAAAVDRLEDCYRWTFQHAADVVARIGAVIDGERQCCRFLRFSMEADPDLGTVTLTISGPSGTAEFLESWLPSHQ